MTLLLDVAPVAGGIGAFIAVAFFLAFAAVAFITFRMLRRTVKMAVRVAVVGVIMLIAAAGSVALWAVTKGSKAERPRPTRPR